MKDKLLTWEQDYDVTNHTCIIEKNELEDYIKYWIETYIQRHSNFTMKYVSHAIHPHGQVSIKFERGPYISAGRNYPEGIEHGGFNFIELDKMKIWKNKN